MSWNYKDHSPKVVPIAPDNPRDTDDPKGIEYRVKTEARNGTCNLTGKAVHILSGSLKSIISAMPTRSCTKVVGYEFLILNAWNHESKACFRRICLATLELGLESGGNARNRYMKSPTQPWRSTTGITAFISGKSTTEHRNLFANVWSAHILRVLSMLSALTHLY